MTKYVAMIRGVGPEDPNMRGERLKWAFEQMGHTNVRPFLTSGNVLFESDITDTHQLEVIAEEALPRVLDFSREVFVRSQADLQAIVDTDPFKGLVHQNGGKTYLTVTFFKTPPTSLPPCPISPRARLTGCCVRLTVHSAAWLIYPLAEPPTLWPIWNASLANLLLPALTLP